MPVINVKKIDNNQDAKFVSILSKDQIFFNDTKS